MNQETINVIYGDNNNNALTHMKLYGYNQLKREKKQLNTSHLQLFGNLLLAFKRHQTNLNFTLIEFLNSD